MESLISHAQNAAPRSRRASDRNPMGEITGRIERAYGTSDYALAAELLEDDMLVAWYGFEPETFASMVTTLAQEGYGDGLISGMAHFMSIADVAALNGAAAGEHALGGVHELELGADIGASLAPELEPALRREMLSANLRGFALRLQGQPTEALEASRQMREYTSRLRPVFDPHSAWVLFSAVQHGITAMLAGRFNDALTSFAEAQMHLPVPELAFLARDAYLRAGIIHAVYGDEERARLLLQQAAAVPRTPSWVEPMLDASRDMLIALVETSDPQEALRLLQAIPQQAIGELWPFHAAAVQRVLSDVGRHEEARGHLALLEALPLPRREGDGFSGSVIHLCTAMNQLTAGDLAGARGQVERGDQSIALTKLTTGVVDLVAGRPREALKNMHDLRADTTGLRTMNLWRLATMAGAHLLLGEPDESLEILDHTTRMTGGPLRPSELKWFTAEVRRLGASRVEGWPDDSALVEIDPYALVSPSEVLTIRELDVLRDLATGRSREEIAKSQFISVNTLKAHLRAVYRKLGVKSRAAAVLEAERRGLV